MPLRYLWLTASNSDIFSRGWWKAFWEMQEITTWSKSKWHTVRGKWVHQTVNHNISSQSNPWNASTITDWWHPAVLSIQGWVFSPFTHAFLHYSLHLQWLVAKFPTAPARLSPACTCGLKLSYTVLLKWQSGSDRVLTAHTVIGLMCCVVRLSLCHVAYASIYICH